MKDVNFWINVVISIITGLATAIPLIIKLVQTIKECVKEKNWTSVMQIVLKLMTEAEQNYQTGADKKKYVMDSIDAIQESLNYEIDANVISAMIDSICDAGKKINVK